MTPLWAVLAVTFLCSLGGGVFWHGLPFIAKHTYGFSQTRNLVLAAVMGVVYTIGAFRAGAITRWAERWASPRAVLALCCAVEGLACLLPLVVAAEWALWVATLGGTFVMSLLWPLVESYVTAGRHGPDMRSAIGWFNLTWAPAVALPLFAMAPLLEHHGQWAIGAFAVTNGIALLVLARFAARPGHHDPDVAGAHVGREYALLLHSARVLLPLSYVLTSAMQPLLPYRFEALDVDVWWEMPAAGTWTVVRLGAFIVMWRARFWHGRWGTLLLGATAMAGGFALVVMGPSVWAMLGGFAVLGAGVGVIYFAALYYAMAVGFAAVDAGGTHEGLIGTGYAVGPVAGLAGATIAGGAGIVAAAWALAALAAVPAVQPYVHARRLRASTTDIQARRERSGRAASADPRRPRSRRR